MKCNNCVKNITKNLKSNEYVIDAEVSLEKK